MSCFLFIPTPPQPAGLPPHPPEEQAGKVRWEVRLRFGCFLFCLRSVADRQMVHSTPTQGSSARPWKGCVLVTSEPHGEARGSPFLLGSMLLLVIIRGVGEGGPPGSQVRLCPPLTLRSVLLRKRQPHLSLGFLAWDMEYVGLVVWRLGQLGDLG